MSQSFSTDVIPISDRLDAWLWNAKQICGDCRFQFPQRSPFHGSILRRTVAGFDLTRFSSSPVSFAKFPADTRSEDRGCIVITQLEGGRSYRQDGKVAFLRPGDTTLIDSGRPWTSDCTGSCSRLYLRVPRWFLQNRLRIVSVPVLPRISGASGLGASLSHLATSLYEHADGMTIEEGMAGVEAYLDLLSGCVGRPELVSAVGHSTELLSLIERFAGDNLPEPTLNPTEIAAAVGISVRHLHRLFATKGCTLSDWIRHRRLECCRLDLSNLCLRDRSITEIAFLWGFSDSAHFSHLFKKEFGESPRSYRSRVWAVSWNSEEDEPVHSFAKFGHSGRPKLM